MTMGNGVVVTLARGALAIDLSFDAAIADAKRKAAHRAVGGKRKDIRDCERIGMMIRERLLEDDARDATVRRHAKRGALERHGRARRYEALGHGIQMRVRVTLHAGVNGWPIGLVTSFARFSRIPPKPSLFDTLRAGVMHVVADPRIVRRVLKRHHAGPRFGGQVPHARCCVIERTALLRIVESKELTTNELPPTVILVARPDDDDTREIWRRAFHGHVHRHLEERARAGRLTDAIVRERIHRIGQTQFDEIRAVLRGEDLLFATCTDRDVYVEFAAFYSELAHFDPDALEEFFPTLGAEVEKALALDLDAQELLSGCKPEDAPHLAPKRSIVALGSIAPTTVASFRPRRSLRTPSARDAAVEKAKKRGNVVRKLVVRLAANENVDDDIDALARRLRAGFAPDEETTSDDPSSVEAWRDVLRMLAIAASKAESSRALETRILFDLQKACMDAERHRFAVDVLGAIGSLFRRSIVRPLPAVRSVRIARHLARAFALSHRARLPSREHRTRLEQVFHATNIRAKDNARDTIKPALIRAFDAVGLKPTCVPERVARDKLCEEILDLVLTHGSFNISQLRDAISRSSLKLPNLTPSALVRGDALLRADRLLSESLDGVYRRGEIYLRLLQKVSSISFGTKIGRLATLHLVLPLLASFVVLSGLAHLVHPIQKALHHRHHIHLLTPTRFFVLAAFFYGLLHSAGFRRAALATLRVSLGALRAILLVVSAPVRWLFRSRVASFVTKAFVIGLPVMLLSVPAGIIAVIAMALFLATPIGLRVEEATTDAIARHAHKLRRRILPELFALLFSLFKRFVEQVDRAIYIVDEWLTFKDGQSKLALVGKGALGVVWFFATYLIRVYVNVLIEPQVNPIKHFPVVTVSHKIILPLSPTILEVLRQPLLPLGAVIANTVAGATVFLLPGAFGFLVWELKENWNLYDQNRSPRLEPVRVGHHGETMRALLVTGFHSGTVPKAFAKLRHAVKRGEIAKANAFRAELHVVEHGIHDFIERELVGLLREAKRWKTADVELVAIEIGSNRIRIAIACTEIGPEPAWIHFEEQSGLLVASVPSRGFLDALTPAQRTTFEAALAGVYKRAGVDIVREQVESLLGDGVAYDVSDEGLVVWQADYQTEVVYDLSKTGMLEGKVRGNALAEPPPKLDAQKLLLSRQDIAWARWVKTFGEEATSAPFEGPSLLRTTP